MKNNFIIIFLLLLIGSIGQAESSKAFICKAKKDNIEAKLEIDNLGNSILHLNFERQTYSCPLNISFADNLSQAINPLLVFYFQLKTCALPKNLQDVILKDLSLKIDIRNKKGWLAELRWLSYAQPTPCKTSQIEKFDLEMVIKR